jgi:hypothetical protein
VRRKYRKLKEENLTVVEKHFQVTLSFTDHQYHRKWAILTDPRDPAIGVKGYVKCNITVSAKGERVRVHPEVEDEEDIAK